MSLIKNYVTSKILSLIKSWKRPNFDFSQLGEEKIIINIIQRLASKHTINQHYIDIGGFNPILYSNTYKLYQQNWCGVIVEPSTDKTKNWHRIRPRDFVINSAIVTNEYSEEKIKIYFKEKNAANETALPEMDKKNLSYYDAKTIKLSEILSICEKKFSKPFFLNMDIEGAEEKLVLELKNINYKIPLICVEIFLGKNKNDYSVLNYKNIEAVAFLENHGYYLVSVCGPSLIFCDKEIWIPFSKL